MLGRFFWQQCENWGSEVGRVPEGKGRDKASRIVQMEDHENIQCSGNKES